MKRRFAKYSVIAIVVMIGTSVGHAQRIAVLTPDNSETSKRFATLIEQGLKNVVVIDHDLARSAFDAAKFDTPYNLTLEQARHVGQAIGCDFFVLLRSALQRRSSFEKEEYYDATVAVFLVSTRTGRLVGFTTHASTESKPDAAVHKLESLLTNDGRSMAEAVKAIQKEELTAKPPPAMEEPPDEGSPLAQNFRPPVPFQRIKPLYTKLAEQHDVTATVELQVDLDETGKVIRTQTTRWAGFDLDESVDKAVRQMNWRPAERNGKFIPMRFLVRYNFKKTEKPK
ncbi:MAG TPA: energy transducer TonB [Pyrinomonadaceae bacterium]|nr:energy transducer TonB [Pyrinomonadaceae bacterium]